MRGTHQSSHDLQVMIPPVLRVVVVLYRSRLRTLRSLLNALAAANIESPVVVGVVINRDNLRWRRREPRRVSVAAGTAMEICFQDNAGGVASAYNLVIERGEPSDVMIILDADSHLPAAYFAEVWAHRATLRAGLAFVSPELISGSLRISPYRLAGMVPFAIEGELLRSQPLPFASGIGVINAGLAGSINAFRHVNGFSRHIGLDLSDIAWSLQAGRCQAGLTLLSTTHSHHLSIRSKGFGLRRLRRYLAACWRLAVQTRDVYGGLRLALRGLRALRWQRQPA